jgi:hypothetical protein
MMQWPHLGERRAEKSDSPALVVCQILGIGMNFSEPKTSGPIVFLNSLRLSHLGFDDCQLWPGRGIALYPFSPALCAAHVIKKAPASWTGVQLAGAGSAPESGANAGMPD